MFDKTPRAKAWRGAVVSSVHSRAHRPRWRGTEQGTHLMREQELRECFGLAATGDARGPSCAGLIELSEAVRVVLACVLVGLSGEWRDEFTALLAAWERGSVEPAKLTRFSRRKDETRDVRRRPPNCVFAHTDHAARGRGAKKVTQNETPRDAHALPWSVVHAIPT